MGKWFLYTVVCGALPIICRLTIHFLLDEPEVKLFYSGDFLIYGLILHISMLHCLEVAKIKNHYIPTIINGYSLLGIFLYSILLPLTIIPIETLLEERVLLLAAICCLFSMLLSFVLQGCALSGRGIPSNNAHGRSSPLNKVYEEAVRESNDLSPTKGEITNKNRQDSVSLISLLHGLVLDNPLPAKEIAREIGKPYSTLLREINPYDDGAKLGIDTFIQLMKCTNNVDPLKFMAEQLGYKISPDNTHNPKSPIEKSTEYNR